MSVIDYIYLRNKNRQIYRNMFYLFLPVATDAPFTIVLIRVNEIPFKINKYKILMLLL